MKCLKWFLRLLSVYVNPFEKKVDKFFTHIKSTDSLAKIKDKLLQLMKSDLIVVNVWLEKKFKGYRYLSKKTRLKMYENVPKIVAKFEEFREANPVTEEDVLKRLQFKGYQFPSHLKAELIYLFQIMSFLFPGKYYRYIKTASFGKLLRDPNVEKLEGDCNQIVTLYIYLYGLRFPMEDLQIKLLPEHVCLHFKGMDIEATSGEFERYEQDNQILPVTEIISTNLLDLTDFREEVQSISPRILVKSAQLAYAISSLKSFVEKNLRIAYKNLAISAMRSNNFDSAIFYLEKANDAESLKKVYRNAAIYYMKAKNFAKAGFYAEKSSDVDLKNSIKHNQAVYFYQSGNYVKALELFKDLGDSKMEKACYMQEYSILAKKVTSVKTLADAKKHKSVYREMLALARKIGDKSLEEGIQSTLSRI